MAVRRMLSVERLRERAEQCRQLAHDAHSHGIAAELESLAIDYEKDAAGLEALGANYHSPHVL